MATQNTQESEAKLVAELRAKLDSMERMIKERDAQLEQLREDPGNGLKVRADARKPYVGPNGGYLIEVGPNNPKSFPHLKPLKMHACDSTELLRYYTEINSDKPNSNKALDPMKCSLYVINHDEKKLRTNLAVSARLANIRAKIAAGSPVSDADQKAVDDAYDAIHGG